MRSFQAKDFEKAVGPMARTYASPIAPPVCAVCAGTGWLRRAVPFGAPDWGTVVACECTLQQSQAELSRRLPPAQRAMTFCNFQPYSLSQKEAMALALELASAAPGFSSLLLIGRVGVGKTHLAAAAVSWYQQEASDAGRLGSARLVYVPALLDGWQAAQEDGLDGFEEAYRPWRDRGLLALDDLGAEKDTAWRLEKLSRLVNDRWESRLPTIVTTNLHSQAWLAGMPQDLRTAGERIISRIADQRPGWSRVVEMLGRDARGGG